MKKLFIHLKSLIFYNIILITFTVNGQLNVDISYSAFDLVQNILIGQGVTVTNVQFTGNNAQKAYFYGTTNIGFTDGVLLTTGGATVAIGPNNTGSAEVPVNTPGDADLENIINYVTNDASVLEFDFIPQADTISFYYVFASEEYPEFVGTQYNDVFAFLLTGPDPNGGMYNKKNIALIPNTTLPVTINNVNHLSYSQYYVDNTNGQTIQFDGFTVPLKAFAHVVPCQTYHIKLAIADGTDHAYDSGVFFQAGSFTSPSYEINNQLHNSSDLVPPNNIIEGGLNCGSYATICISRNFTTQDNDTVNIILTGDAINGIDYADANGAPVNSQLIFPPNTLTQCIEIYGIADTINEPTENIIIKIPNLNLCIADTVVDTIKIFNHNPMEVSITGDTIVCEGQTGQLIANSTNFPAFFNWSTGSQMGSINIHPTEELTTYWLTGTDNYNCIDSDSITVRLLPFPVVDLGNDTCVTERPYILDATQIDPIYSYKWSTGQTTSSISIIQSGTYWVSVINSQYNKCEVLDTINIRIIPTPIFSLPPNITMCSHDSINLSVAQPEINLYDFLWSDGNTSANYILDGLAPGIYHIGVKVIGCDTLTDSTIVLVNDCHIEIPNVITPNGDGINEQFYITNIEYYPNSEIKIYNRWGKKIYESENYQGDWDGDNHSEGTYFYIFRLNYGRGKIEEYHSTITIIK
jgi:gliding motility-associated-like protein